MSEEQKAAAPQDAQSPKSFTGIQRSRKTRRGVLIADRVSRVLITVGGIGTIFSVLAVALFLFYVVMPLFLPAKVDDLRSVDQVGAELAHAGIDEYQLLAWTLSSSGALEVVRLDTAEKRWRHQLFSEGEMVSSSFLNSSDTAAFGLADGSVQLVDIGFKTRILDAEDLPPDILAELESGKTLVNMGQGVVEPTPGGQYRQQELYVEKGDRSRISAGPVVQVDHVVRTEGPFVIALAQGGAPGAEIDPEEGAGGELSEADPAAAEDPDATPDSEGTNDDVTSAETAVASSENGLRLLAVAWQEDTNFLTGETSFEMLDPVELPFEADTAPKFLEVNGSGTQAYQVWEDGRLVRLSIRNLAEATVAESGHLLPPGSGAQLGFFEPILGGITFLWGDTKGQVNGGFPVRVSDAEKEIRSLYGSDRRSDEPMAFARTKQLASAGAAATASSPSARSRLAFAGFADGGIRLFNITNATEILKTRLPAEEPIVSLVMSPKEDGVLVATTRSLWHGHLDPRYPEAGFSAFFRPVWYEGYAEPQHTWQSSSGTDDFEMKLGLMPLVFGTLKATFYSMLFGVPLALLAAIFTSEFLHGKVKNVIKPSIEFMASLPSVVLGFLAALVFAPYIEKVVPATLAVFFTLPIALLLGAYAWQLLPSDKAVMWAGWRFPLMGVLIFLGLGVAGLIGPAVESLFFAGDIKGWLAAEPETGERFASPIGGLMFICLPLSALVVALGLGRFVSPIMRDKSSQWDRRQYATMDLAKFFAAIVATFVLALSFSWVVAMIGFDPRGSYLDTYIQRNALVVGFVMGFAIIPIIYTIAEDALSTVPSHLRSASLGAGATPWQTAVRIVIPTAMSGLFSAMMIGLGRAVGETMIVLMAAGNTPVMKWNVFEGFRTLSANIAVELPEAVRGDTHYRTLFLAALVLFVMTFVVNTIAESIRLRFRKRAHQL